LRWRWGQGCRNAIISTAQDEVWINIDKSEGAVPGA
jgi:hypothetical protein